MVNQFVCTPSSTVATSIEAMLTMKPTELLNVIVRALLRTISHDEPPERNPFK